MTNELCCSEALTIPRGMQCKCHTTLPRDKPINKCLHRVLDTRTSAGCVETHLQALPPSAAKSTFVSQWEMFHTLTFCSPWLRGVSVAARLEVLFIK